MSKHIIYNGELIKNENIFNATHPLFKGANVLRFNAMVVSSELPFYQEHFRMIANYADIKGLEMPSWMSASTFNQDIFHLLQKNRIYQGGIIQMILYNDVPGKKADYIISAEKYHAQNFILNEDGYLIDVYRKKKLYSGSAEIYDAGYSPTETSALYDMHSGNFQQMILLNEHNHIARFVGSNIVIIDDNAVYTPATDEGSINDVMREKFIEVCLNLKFKVYDDCIIHTNNLNSAKEVFALHPVFGIKWVVGYGEKRFYRNKLNKIHQELNNLFFKNNYNRTV